MAAMVLAAMVWSAVPQALDAWFGRTVRARPPSAPVGSVTVLILVEGDSPDVVRVGAVAAAASLPTIVVAADANELRSVPSTVATFVGTTVEDAINGAVLTIDTDAVLLLSARSFVDAPSARAAAGMIRDGAGWVIGACRTFNNDGFAPLWREQLRCQVRTSARAAGLRLWEPDATVVKTQLLRDHPLDRDLPWAHSLRSAAGAGQSGIDVRMTLAFTAEPVNSSSYWPMSVLRRRRAVADLADAFRFGGARERCLAGGLLLRELDGYPLALWLLSPWLITRTQVPAFHGPPALLLTLWAGPAVLRWFVERAIHGVPIHPLDDALARAFDAPTSIMALPSAVTLRAVGTRLHIPRQPLLVAGTAFAAATLVPLFSTGTTVRRHASAGLALTELALLWLVAMRAVFQWNWVRTTYRIPARLAVRVDRIAATTLNISPTGIAIEGPIAAVPSDRDVSLDLTLDDGTNLSAWARVVDRRARNATDVAGIALRVPADAQPRWIAQLARSAALAPALERGASAAAASVPFARAPLPTRLVVRATTALVAIFSLVAAVVLCMTLIGYQPLIIRSGSMQPALDVGDVVVVADVEADQLAVGDIATLRGVRGQADTLTHRVTAISTSSGSLTVTTQGDANSANESQVLQPDAIVGRVVFRVPRIGAGVAWAGSGRARLAVAVGAACIGTIVWRRLRARPRVPL